MKNFSLAFYLVFIFTSFIFTSQSFANETVYCKYSTGKSYPSHQCSAAQIEISNKEFCNQQSSEPNLMGYVINKHCSDNLNIKDYSTTTDKKICKMLVRKDGTINEENEKITEESINRNLSTEDCKNLTGRFTKEEKQYNENQARVAQKKVKINQMKLDCEDLGFTKDTEGMGNCVLKLMELDRGNTVTTSYSSGSNKELLDIEREKLEALKAQTEEARRQANEAKRQADEAKKANRREGLKNAQDQIKKGSCIMTRSDYWNC